MSDMREYIYYKEKKSTALAIILLLFFGGLGAHWFYLNSPVRGIIYLLVTISGWFLYYIPNIILIVILFFELFFMSIETNCYNNNLKKRLFGEESQNENY